jgi:hypothetical protein
VAGASSPDLGVTLLLLRLPVIAEVFQRLRCAVSAICISAHRK